MHFVTLFPPRGVNRSRETTIKMEVLSDFNPRDTFCTHTDCNKIKVLTT